METNKDAGSLVDRPLHPLLKVSRLTDRIIRRDGVNDTNALIGLEFRFTVLSDFPIGFRFSKSK